MTKQGLKLVVKLKIHPKPLLFIYIQKLPFNPPASYLVEKVALISTGMNKFIGKAKATRFKTDTV